MCKGDTTRSTTASTTSSETRSSLQTCKDARKRAEVDARLLANRIALLKQEEGRAWKKIEETRKRAQETRGIRAKNDEKDAAKEQLQKDKFQSMCASQQLNVQKRDENKAGRNATRQALLSSRQQSFKAGKKESNMLLSVKHSRDAKDLETNTRLKTIVKQKQEEGRRKLESNRLSQLQKVRVDYEAKSSQENLIRVRTEALTAKMEKEEAELILRLQNTQAMQRYAFEELEAAHGSPTSPLQPISTPLYGY